MYPIICEQCGRFIFNPLKSYKLKYSNRNKCGRLCRTHMSQLRDYGYFLDDIQRPHRINHKKNKYYIVDDYIVFELYDYYGNIKDYGYLSIEDLPLLDLCVWQIQDCYIFNSKYGRLHKLVMDGDLIDHINRNTLDNRRCNLRSTTKSINAVNTSIRKSNSSGITGVYFSKRGYWVAQIQIHGKRLGCRCDSKDGAIKQRLIWEYEYMGDFTPQSHLFKVYLNSSQR